MKTAILAMVLMGCAATMPYISESRVGDGPFNLDRGIGTKLITAHNPLDRHVTIFVECVGNFSGGIEETYSFHVAPGGEQRAMVTVENRYLVGEACRVLHTCDAFGCW